MRRILQPLTALVSLGTLAGIVYWGVTIAQLDPNTVPVIAKINGPARVAPADPGGLRADHQGLAVNAVQAQGGVETPTERVVLAPRTIGLTVEDVAGANLVALIQDEETKIKASKTKLVSPVIVKAPEPDIIDQPEQFAALDIETTATDAPKPKAFFAELAPLPADVIRPRARPRTLVPEIVVQEQKVASIGDPLSTVELGSKLVQLGAFDSFEGAKNQWSVILRSNKDLLAKKDYIIQSANSGGRKFYRLRAVGFGSIGEARALCTALKSRKTPCIAVTAR